MAYLKGAYELLLCDDITTEIHLIHASKCNQIDSSQVFTTHLKHQSNRKHENDLK